MKEIKIKFVDFWEHWDQENNFIVNILKKHFNVVLSEEPDYVFYSNFSKRLDHMKYNEAVKIFYTQENICPDFNFADYGIGFERIRFEDRYLQFPICYIAERYGKDWKRMLSKHSNVHEEKKFLNRGFCSFVVSNSEADPIRDEIFTKLSLYKKVDSGGRYRNNIDLPNGILNKFEFTKKYKFSLCFENSSHPGYYTEKLVEAFSAQTVPIYWGDPYIGEVFNEKSFINLSKCKTVTEMIETIKVVDSNPSLYIAMLKEPALNDENREIWEKKQKELNNFLFNIFKVSKVEAHRRNLVFWGERYYRLMRKMRNWYVLFFQNKVEIAIVKKLKKIKKLI